MTDALRDRVGHTEGPWVIEDDWLQSAKGPCVGGHYFSVCVSATSEPDRNLLMNAPDMLAMLEQVAEGHALHSDVLDLLAKIGATS